MTRLVLTAALIALGAAPSALAQTVWITGGLTEHDAVQTRAAAVGARVDVRPTPVRRR